MWLGLFSITEDPATWHHRDRRILKFSPRSASWVETYFVFLYLWALPWDWASLQGQPSESCPPEGKYKDKQPKENRLSYWPNASWLCRHLKPWKFYMCEEDGRCTHFQFQYYNNELPLHAEEEIRQFQTFSSREAAIYWQMKTQV